MVISWRTETTKENDHYEEQLIQVKEFSETFATHWCKWIGECIIFLIRFEKKVLRTETLSAAVIVLISSLCCNKDWSGIYAKAFLNQIHHNSKYDQSRREGVCFCHPSTSFCKKRPSRYTFPQLGKFSGEESFFIVGNPQSTDLPKVEWCRFSHDHWQSLFCALIRCLNWKKIISSKISSFSVSPAQFEKQRPRL